MRIARERGLFEPVFYNLGDFSLQAQHRVDDKPYGGGAGALIEIEPMYRAITSIEEKIKRSAMDSTSRSSTSSELGWNDGGVRKIYL